MVRAVTSVLPPAPKLMTKLISLAGYPSVFAQAGPAESSAATATGAQQRRQRSALEKPGNKAELNTVCKRRMARLQR
jgi:hypothetical protein